MSWMVTYLPRTCTFFLLHTEPPQAWWFKIAIIYHGSHVFNKLRLGCSRSSLAESTHFRLFREALLLLPGLWVTWGGFAVQVPHSPQTRKPIEHVLMQWLGLKRTSLYTSKPSPLVSGWHTVTSNHMPLAKANHMAKPKIKEQRNWLCSQWGHGNIMDAGEVKAWCHNVIYHRLALVVQRDN